VSKVENTYQFVGRWDVEPAEQAGASGGQRPSMRLRIFSAMMMASEMAHSSAGLGFDSHRAIRLAARIPAVISSAPLRISFTRALYHLRFFFATEIS
jgi:hypothetical protein